MSRTKRNTQYNHCFAMTKKEAKDYASKYDDKYSNYFYRYYLLHGTDAVNVSPKSHEYFNRANRVGRRVARDQLRPQCVTEEDFDFDDSRYRAKYKGVWWEIY